MDIDLTEGGEECDVERCTSCSKPDFEPCDFGCEWNWRCSECDQGFAPVITDEGHAEWNYDAEGNNLGGGYSQDVYEVR